MTRAETNSWRTAIKRRHVSAPAKWLCWQPGITNGRVLDYGCGRGDDADLLDLERYDPHFAPTMPRGVFSVILCTYVLNTLPKSREQAILGDILDRLAERGVAYITVRRNVKRTGYTSRGTYQRNVRLRLPIVHENSDFCIYRMARGKTLLNQTT